MLGEAFATPSASALQEAFKRIELELPWQLHRVFREAERQLTRGDDAKEPIRGNNAPPGSSCSRDSPGVAVQYTHTHVILPDDPFM
jgi:hypothetical protein